VGTTRSAPAMAAPVDLEARTGAGDHQALKLWLRLLACTTHVEAEIRQRLRREFGISLARFDLLAQLERSPDGLKMGELSRRMMVSGGNVTGLTDELTKEGLVERRDDPADRRAYTVHLTPAGRSAFARMAVAHEQWVIGLLGGLAPGELAQAYGLLGTLREHLTTTDRTQSGDRR
jgi:DNA-binding MarR family transcriptional regulator